MTHQSHCGPTLSRRARQEALLLPTSPPSDSPAALVEFAEAAFARLLHSGRPEDDVALLASPLVPAHVSALVSADPNHAEIRIDALWGYPDGLLYLPHDSFSVREGRVRASIRYKPACLVLAVGERREVRVGPGWDWARTLSASEALHLATWASELARLEAGRRSSWHLRELVVHADLAAVCHSTSSKLAVPAASLRTREPQPASQLCDLART